MLNSQKVMKLDDLIELDLSKKMLLEIEQSRKAIEEITLA